MRTTAICRAMLCLLEEVGVETFPTLIAWNTGCDELEEAGGPIRRLRYSDIRHFDRGELPQLPALVANRSIFLDLSPLGTLLDASVPVDGTWSGDSWSYSSQPLRTVVTVKSRSERISVPAGTFADCLLIEQVTTEQDRPDDALEKNRQANRDSLCGTRRAWYAPGVGLVQVSLQGPEGDEALIQLREFAVDPNSTGYLPLSLNNEWSYTWANLPPEISGREVYRVAARKEDRWYMQSRSYLRRLHPSGRS
jgi:hypothetical protein